MKPSTVIHRDPTAPDPAVCFVGRLTRRGCKGILRENGQVYHFCKILLPTYYAMTVRVYLFGCDGVPQLMPWDTIRIQDSETEKVRLDWWRQGKFRLEIHCHDPKGQIEVWGPDGWAPLVESDEAVLIDDFDGEDALEMQHPAIR